MPSMPDLSAYMIVEEDDGTFAVVHTGTGTAARLDGVPQLGLDLDRADDVAGHLETMDHIAAARGTGRLDS